ncbi:hypothetical protein GOBAR_AA17748 [Gossypium barbadense]|uniref:Uncharacterized protein n=1 Tax=Gossypium barbadense TaxID=3634 RepID=A0A2P5XHU6_GOSBA|nr:hypothetical protein GOBAR_AA17748 [Gossypium barbadense]
MPCGYRGPETAETLAAPQQAMRVCQTGASGRISGAALRPLFSQRPALRAARALSTLTSTVKIGERRLAKLKC